MHKRKINCKLRKHSQNSNESLIFSLLFLIIIYLHSKIEMLVISYFMQTKRDLVFYNYYNTVGTVVRCSTVDSSSSVIFLYSK